MQPISPVAELQVISEVFLRAAPLQSYHRAHDLFVCQGSDKRTERDCFLFTYAPVLVPRTNCALACRVLERASEVRTFRTW